MRRRFFTVSGTKFDYNNYMTIEAISEYVNVSIPREVMYGINGIGWYEYKGNTTGELIRIKKGDLLSIKSNILPYEIFGYILIEGNCNLKGNCLSLVFGDKAGRNNDLTNYPNVFQNLFGRDTIINVDTNFLPATTLANTCYDNMFRGCTSLVNAPELPATTLAYNCYQEMFYGCTNLVNAPELPATTLVDRCYDGMFYGCTNLNYIKMLATDISADHCLDNWVYGVSSTGVFVKSKDATWDVVGVSGVPTGWTVITDEEESGGGKITNNIILSYDGSGSFLRKIDVEMDYPAASDLIIQRSSDEGITWADLPPILAGTSNFTSTVYHLAGHIYRLKTAEDDTYVYTFTVEER